MSNSLFLLSYWKTIYFTKTKLTLLSLYSHLNTNTYYIIKNNISVLFQILIDVSELFCGLRQVFVPFDAAKVRTFWMRALIIIEKTLKRTSLLDVYQCMCAHTSCFLSHLDGEWLVNRWCHEIYWFLIFLLSRTPWIEPWLLIWETQSRYTIRYVYVSFYVCLCFLFT